MVIGVLTAYKQVHTHVHVCMNRAVDHMRLSLCGIAGVALLCGCGPSEKSKRHRQAAKCEGGFAWGPSQIQIRTLFIT